MRCLALALATILTAPAAVGCARARAGEPLATPGDPEAIAAARKVLEDTVAEQGAASEKVISAADALIDARPDPGTAARAWLLKAEALFAQGDDASAMVAATTGLELGGGSWVLLEPPNAQFTPAPSDGPAALDVTIREGLERVWIRAVVRGGDPTRAAAVVRSAWVGAESSRGADSSARAKGTGAVVSPAATGPRLFTAAEWRGLLAVAEHRRGKSEAALLAIAAWRSTLAAGDPGTSWAETKLAENAAALHAAAPRSSGGQSGIGQASTTDAAFAGLDDTQRAAVTACLQRVGSGLSTLPSGPAAETPAAPRWTERCMGPTRSIGVLLPRAGKLSALADAQLEGIEVGLGLLTKSAGGSSAGRRVTWLDAGSDEAGMRRAGSAAIRAGIDTVIGPVGHDNVTLAARVLPGFTLVIPGEVTAQPAASGSAGKNTTVGSELVGAAPTLEARVGALVQSLKAEGVTRLVILSPASSYGQRAVAAAKASSREVGIKSTEFIEYPIGTTSFSAFTDPLRGANAEVAIVVLDALPRVEAVLRQLRRDAIVGGAKGARFASTAEGFDPSRLTAARGVFEGAFMAPPAFVNPDDPFARAFAARFGREPSDQAVLAWQALLRATGGGDPATAAKRPIVGVVKGDRLVSR